ncbi:MAG: mechanosensitive ion channel family protein, partial [Caldilineaceae bacterium]|nr:mechanosensitive ion channel family protein [Caldilineaceae bacterium]
LGLLVALAIVAPSVKPVDILSTLGIGGVAIGFAFRDILQNFLAGLLILLRQPFRIGDQIVVGDYEGTVEEIETRATMIKTYDGRRVVIPNGDIYTSSVVVNTAFEKRRSQYDVGIGYGDDIARAKELMLQAMRQCEGVLSDPVPDVLTVELAGSSVNLRARWWTHSTRSDVVKVSDRVISAIKDDLSAAGIDLPFPTQVVLWHDQTEETDGDRNRQREGWPAGGHPPKARPRSRALYQLND